MQAMFIKEMRQFLRGVPSKIGAGLAVLSWVMVGFAWKVKAPTLDALRTMGAEDVPGYIAVFLFQLGIFAAAFFGLLFILGSSAGRWRLELGDPAFSPGITTCTPAWKLALGKFLALMCQMFAVLLLAGILPSLVFKYVPAVRVINEFVTETANANPKLASFNSFRTLEYSWAVVCATLSWGTLTLALCSLKPRSRGKFDLGSIAAMLVLLPQTFVLIGGVSFDKFGMLIAIRTMVSVVGGFTLICSGVSAPSSNRLFLFKTWMFVSVLGISPLLYKLQGVFTMKMYASELVVTGIFFLFSSLFERVTQSRRVLTALNNPVWAAVSFPFTTGALNSFALAAIFIALGWSFSPEMGNVNLMMIGIFAVVAAFANFIGLVNERKAFKISRLLIFFLAMLGVAIAAGVMAQHDISIDMEKYGDVVCVILLLAALGLCAPLIKYYNYRKKHL
ncbi:MAG: hypothetical protein IKC89_02950 [Lentisphaeria bacterium]|nr:hypothetical protein [Lentisphaeria bacterium]